MKKIDPAVIEVLATNEKVFGRLCEYEQEAFKQLWNGRHDIGSNVSTWTGTGFLHMKPEWDNRGLYRLDACMCEIPKPYHPVGVCAHVVTPGCCLTCCLPVFEKEPINEVLEHTNEKWKS
jgi:hypothetical protein